MGREQAVSVSKEMMLRTMFTVTMDDWESDDYGFKPDIKHDYLIELK